jgi:hypothetical protein
MANTWNDEVARVFSSTVQTAKDSFNTNKDIPVSQAPSKVLNISGAEAAITQAKSRMEMSVQTIRSIANNIANINSRISSRSSDINSEIAAAKRALVEQTTNVENAQTIADLRSEQSAALRNKYASNLHTSWLGLWRPLAAETRTGLGVAAAAFGVLALLTIVYLVASVVSTATRGGASTTNISTTATTISNNVNRLIGGAMKRLRGEIPRTVS